jgi:hypothetical protein
MFFDNSFLEKNDICFLKMIFNLFILENDWALVNGIWFNMMDMLLENEVVKIVTWRRS